MFNSNLLNYQRLLNFSESTEKKMVLSILIRKWQLTITFWGTIFLDQSKMLGNHESLQQTTLFLGFACSTPPFSGKRTIIEWDAAIHHNPPPFAAYWETVENREKRWSHVEFPYLKQVWICSKSRHLRNIIGKSDGDPPFVRKIEGSLVPTK